MYRKFLFLFTAIGISVFFISLCTEKIISESQIQRLQEDTWISAGYREQYIGEELLSFLKENGKPGEFVAVYLIESNYGYQGWKNQWTKETFQQLEKKWKRQRHWNAYLEVTEAIWNDVTYFPVPESTTDSELTVSYVNTWMAERTYGGERGHEGSDLMARKNTRGLYPVISMTDGIVKKKGWLNKGGYRIGIESPGGAYFYYAHLDSYASLEEGDIVKAGDILGFMGDSGYGEEGTVGKFPVHLHLGIYIYHKGKEISINPYWVLRYIENRKVKCYTEI